MTGAVRRRRSGLVIPLFSCPSSASWGIGEIGDVATLAAWLEGAGQRALQLLPLNEMAEGSQSPYSALSAMAIDPVFISLRDVPDFAALGGEAALDDDERDRLEAARRARRVDYAAVRPLKHAALSRSFARFVDTEWRRDTERARALRTFVDAEAWWLADYALFRALHERYGHASWTSWPAPFRTREPRALEDAARELSEQIRFRQYLQWIASLQWTAARSAAKSHGVALFGDLPFMVDGDSADVWSHQEEFWLDRSVGVPPDAFSATGQDWGMPPYRWSVVASRDFGWLRQRARRSAAIFDGFRVDHLVGFYRTYSRPREGGLPSFEPAVEAEQMKLGEQTISVFRSSGAEIVAEDLGVVPDFVRESLNRLDVPGLRVFRWEREWNQQGSPFRDPAVYPASSVACSGTHDTEPVAVWWEQASEDERRRVLEIPSVRRLAAEARHDGGYSPAVRDTLLEALMASGSDLCLMPIQDVFGWRDRINQPATVTPENWSWRLPWPSDRLQDEPSAVERQQALRRWSQRHNRLSG